MKDVVIERLNILNNEVGGSKKFIEKLDEVQFTSDEIINERTIKNWLSGNKKLDLYNAYLIAKAFHVSMNWLLGLTDKKNKNIVFYKRPATYGDVLIFLGQLFETGTAETGTSTHRAIENEVFIEDDLILPQYIIINDENLHELIENLSHARSLNENDFIDSLEEMFESQMEQPLQNYSNNSYHNEKHPKASEYTGDDTVKKALSYDDLKGKIAGQLEKLLNGMSYQNFADKIGCSKSTLSDWINKKTMLRIDNICLIANKLEKSADWILGLDEIENRNKFYKGEQYTCGSVLYILGHLIANGTIGFVDELSSIASDDENDSKMNDIFRIDDGFLFCLLLRMESLTHNPNAPKGKLKQLFETYKNTPLLSFNIENRKLRPDMGKILCNTKGNKRNLDMDLDKLYENLQTLTIK